jgi:hypothetical protein
VPPLLPISAPSVDIQSDLHRLADTGWFDKLDVNLDHTFDQGFLDSSAIRKLLKGVSLSL